MHRANPIAPRTQRPRLATARRFLIGSSAALLCALLLLLIHIFSPLLLLQLAALWLLGAGFLLAWVAILSWRMPVFAHRVLGGFSAVWAIGVALSVWLTLASVSSGEPLIWQLSVQWLALSISFAVGALLLRALLHKRASTLVGRLLSLLSPLLILVLILSLYR